MASNFKSSDILKRVLNELPIETLLQHILDNDLISEQLKETVNGDNHNFELTINKHIVNKELISFNHHYSQRRVNLVCPFHDTLSNDSTYYYHGVDSPRLTCRSAHCKVGVNKQTYNVVDLYQMLVFNVPPSLLYLEGNNTFITALQECAKLVGIPWHYDKRDYSDEEKKEFRRYSIFKTFIEITHESFLKNNAYSRKSREYFFYERGFGKLGFKVRKMIRDFNIGYTGGKYGSTFIYKIMKKKGFTDEELLDSGLFVFKKDKNFETGESTTTDIIVDMFYQRLIFGYKRKNNFYDGVYGRHISFKKDIEEAKKKMSAEKFEDYLKSIKRRRHLRTSGRVSEPINFHRASMFNSLIFVEGEIDFLTLFGLGFENSVAVGGTNGIDQKDIDSMRHKRIVSKYTVCNTIYLLFDNDENDAGETAMFNVGLSFVEAGFDVRVVRIPEGDPNDCLINHGLGAKDIIQKALDEAISFEAFYVEGKLKNANLSSFASIKSNLANLREFITRIPKHELLFIVFDLIHNMKTKLNIPLDDNLILSAFGLKELDSANKIEETNDYILPISNEIVSNNNEEKNNASENNKDEFSILLDLPSIKDKNWVVYFNDMNRYNLFKEITHLENVVFSTDVDVFLDYLKRNLPEVKNVLPDSLCSEKTKEVLKKSGLSNHLFKCEDLSKLSGKFDSFIVKY